MMICIAAASADFSKYAWYTNKGPQFKFDPGNGQQVLIIETGDLIGLKKTTRGPTAGLYQVVLQKYPQWIFRSVVPESVENHVKQFEKYDGIPPKPEKEGKRYTRVHIKGLDATDKQSAERYKPIKAPVEHGEYNKSNYQWREVVAAQIMVKTMHYGKVREPLKAGDVVGMRFVSEAKGGFIILPSGERLNVDVYVYDDIVSGARILPHAEQRVGVVVLSEIKHLLPKTARTTSARIGRQLKDMQKQNDIERDMDDDIERDMDEEIDKKAQARRGRAFVKTHQEIVSDFEYDTDEGIDFEDDDDFELDTDEENVNTEEAPEQGLDFKPFEEGMILTAPNGSEFVVIAIEEAGLSDNIYMYDRKSQNIKIAKVPTGIDAFEYDKAKVTGYVDIDELSQIKRSTIKLIEKRMAR